MPFFYERLRLQTRLSPPEVEKRLSQIVRKPRTLREVIRRKPANLPLHADFVGFVKDGRFKVTRLVLAPDDLSYSYIRTTVRGRITPAARGSQIEVFFCDPALSAMALSMILGGSFVVLANTQGWPLWQAGHLMLVALISTVLWFCRYSLNDNIEKSKELLQRCVK
jgi:hypothetical protein